jgi:PAS domain S-box-containing protein
MRELSSVLLKAVMASKDSVVITDATQPDNPIIFVNPAFEALTGYTFVEIKGRNCRFLQGNERDQPARRRLRGAILIGDDCRETITNFKKNGTPFQNELSISPVYDRSGIPRYFIGIQHEVS